MKLGVWDQITYLYELDEPLEVVFSDDDKYFTDHIVVLFIDSMFGGRDVQILPCDSEGDVTDCLDLMDNYNMKDIMDEFNEEDPDHVLKYAGIGF